MATTSLLHLAMLAPYVMVLVMSSKIEVPAGGPEKTEMKRSGSDCYVAGHVFRHGEEFSYPGYSHCIKYRCDNGNFFIVKSACERKSRCVPLDSVIQEDCRSLRCVSEKRDNSNMYYMEPTAQDQCEHQGRCVPKNQDIVLEDCFTYRCVATPYGGYKFDVVHGVAKCRDVYGNCVNVGERFGPRNNCVCLQGGSYRCVG